MNKNRLYILIVVAVLALLATAFYVGRITKSCDALPTFINAAPTLTPELPTFAPAVVPSKKFTKHVKIAYADSVAIASGEDTAHVQATDSLIRNDPKIYYFETLLVNASGDTDKLTGFSAGVWFPTIEHLSQRSIKVSEQKPDTVFVTKYVSPFVQVRSGVDFSTGAIYPHTGFGFQLGRVVVTPHVGVIINGNPRAGVSFDYIPFQF